MQDPGPAGSPSIRVALGDYMGDMDEMYEEGYEEGLEDAYGGDFGA